MHPTQPHSLSAARHSLADLFQPDPKRFWAELLGNAAIGWGSIALAITNVGGLAGSSVAVLVAVFSLHRATTFLHELSHLNDRALPHVRLGWNVLWGLPFLLPSWLYERMHLDHHRRRIYGTTHDPEYLPLASMRPLVIVGLGSMGIFLPVVLLLRFMVLTPLAWLIAPVRRLVDARFSTLATNPKWVMPAPDAVLHRRMRRDEVIAFVMTWSLAIAAWGQLISVRTLAVPLLVMFGAVICNQFRAMAAHRFERDGTEGNEMTMFADCLNVETENPLERLLLPMGVGLHALHHFAPAIPFHNLRRAHRRLRAGLTANPTYGSAQSDGLMRTLGRLLRTAGRVQHPPSVLQ